MRLAGWRIEGKLPDLPKFVLIGAPHTSNWDFVLFLGVIFTLRANVRFMGKAEIFRSPFGFFFRYCGGVPVERKKSTGLVEQMVNTCNKSESFILTIAPEGTRHHVQEWKSGFYHVALGANVPVFMGYLDYKNKIAGYGPQLTLTGDKEKDAATIRAFYSDKTAKYPELFNLDAIRFDP